MSRAERRPLYYNWTPKYWPTWLGLGLLRLSCLLPYKWQIGLGKWIGRLAHRIGAERRAIARRNIELCFLALGRWASEKKLLSMTTVKGGHHIQQTLDEGYGVMLISAHFTALDVAGRALRQHCPPYDVIYRSFRSPLTTEIVASTREVTARQVIEKNDIKGMIRSLREGIPVWYAPDQSYHLKQSALLPFFGVPAMSNIATTTIAKLGKAKAVPFWPRRLPEGGYEILIEAPLEGLPSDDPEEDTRKYVAALEAQIRRCPEQYYWVHRKFKNRPDSLPDVYADLDALK
jgi:KDO2-lipid IV(A) lauroyltransferase